MKFILVVLSLSFVGCANMSAQQHGLARIKTNFDREYQTEKGSKDFTFEDKNLKLSYEPDTVDAGVSFVFQNKSSEVIKILWDESTFIDHTGQPDRVIHNGVKIADRNASQPASIIPPGGRLKDHLVPSSKISWESGSAAGGVYYAGGWEYEPLCGTKNLLTWELEDDSCVGQTFGYFITYEIEGKKHHTQVKFKLVSRTEKQKDTKVSKGAFKGNRDLGSTTP